MYFLVKDYKTHFNNSHAWKYLMFSNFSLCWTFGGKLPPIPYNADPAEHSRMCTNETYWHVHKPTTRLPWRCRIVTFVPFLKKNCMEHCYWMVKRQSCTCLGGLLLDVTANLRYYCTCILTLIKLLESPGGVILLGTHAHHKKHRKRVGFWPCGVDNVFRKRAGFWPCGIDNIFRKRVSFSHQSLTFRVHI